MTWQNNIKKMQSFIFGGETGNTYEDIQAQRALADQMQQRVAGSAPSTFGEGLSAIRSAIAYRRANNKASKGEAAGRETFNNDFNDLMSSYSTPSFNPSQTVRDKVERQMAGHRRKAAQLLGTDFSAPAQPSSPYTPQQRAQNPRMAQQNQFDPRMLELMSNPYATQGQKAFMQLMMQKQMQGSDPMRQMQLQKMELELQQMQNPDRQTVKGADGYLYYQDNGERVLPGVTAAPKSNGVNVTVNNAGDTPQVPAYPKAPTGYMYIRDPQGNVMINDQGVAEMAPIIGGPNDHTAEDQINQDNQQRSGDVVIEDIGRVLDMMNSSSLPTTGLVGSASSIVPGTAAHDTSKLLDTIKANVGFDRLQQMRDASPTGGALGQVSELELRLLNSALGSLEQSQSSGQFERNLVRLRDIYHNILHVGIKDSQDIQAYEPPKPPTQETSTSETQSAEPKYGTPEWALWYMQQNGGQ